jgi:hypothetical protein
MLPRSSSRWQLPGRCLRLGNFQLGLSQWLEINNPGTDILTFGPFCCGIYIFLAPVEDLDLIMSKGETLKRMDYTHQKAGIMHPLGGDVIHSFKCVVPNTFGDKLDPAACDFYQY